MRVSQKQLIQEQVINNLLSAHKQAADSGEVKQLIRLSRYVLHLADQIGDVLIDLSPEADQQGSENPVDYLKDFNA